MSSGDCAADPGGRWHYDESPKPGDRDGLGNVYVKDAGWVADTRDIPPDDDDD